MKIAKLSVGAVLALLGLLWTLQGADVLRIKPILCFADCEPLVGGSTTWLAIGLAAAAAGLALIYVAVRKRRS